MYTHSLQYNINELNLLIFITLHFIYIIMALRELRQKKWFLISLYWNGYGHGARRKFSSLNINIYVYM